MMSSCIFSVNPDKVKLKDVRPWNYTITNSLQWPHTVHGINITWEKHGLNEAGVNVEYRVTLTPRDGLEESVTVSCY